MKFDDDKKESIIVFILIVLFGILALNYNCEV